VALRQGIGNPKCRACYKPGRRPTATYESGAARWGVANASRPAAGSDQLNLASEPSDLDGGSGGHRVAGIDIDDSNRWKKQMRGRAKQGTVEKSGVRGTGTGLAKRVTKLSARVSEVEELKQKRDALQSHLSTEERLKLQREGALREELDAATEGRAR
jgi:hypothetical protein